MQLVDLILLILVGSFGLFGFWFGFVHTLGSLIGTLLGAYLASHYYSSLADSIIHLFNLQDTNTVRVVVFIIAFVIINRLVGFVFWLIDRLLSLVTHLPFINTIDRILGLALGLVEGVITLGLIIFFIERVPLSATIMDQLALSSIAPRLSNVARILWPLLPDAFRVLQSTVDYIQHRFFP